MNQNSFKETMSSLSDDDLVRIVHYQKADYQPEAFEAAVEELSSRNLSALQIEAAKETYQNKKQLSIEKTNAQLPLGIKILVIVLPVIFPALIYSLVSKADGYERRMRDVWKWTLFGIVFYLALGCLDWIFF